MAMEREVACTSSNGTGNCGTCNGRRSSTPDIGRVRFVSHFSSNRSRMEHAVGRLNGRRCVMNMASIGHSDLNKGWNSPPELRSAFSRFEADGESVLVEQALVYLRKNDFESLESLLDPDCALLSREYRSSRLGLTDGGVLSRYATCFDAGSRRLLPSNLLRRSRITGALQCTKELFHVRMAVTSKSGEEGVILWQLRRILQSEGSRRYHPDPGKSNRWVIRHVGREASEEVPHTPHPRVSPEAVLRAHLGALKRGDVMHACMFCADEAYPSYPLSGKYGLDNRGYLDPQRIEIVRGFLALPEYKSLALHTEVVFGEGLLVNQEHVVQEVVLNAASCGWQSFLFHVQLKKNACWMITKIESIPFLSKK